MIRSLVLLLLACASVPAHGAEDLKKLHVLLVTDNTDPTLAPSVTVDAQRLTFLLREKIPEKMLSIKLFEKSKSNSKDIKAYYQALSVGPEDSLLFYYSGHGGQDEKGLFFALQYAGRGAAKDPLYRKELLEIMKAKKAGLTLLLTDCCSNRVATAKGRGMDDEAATARAGIATPKQLDPRIQKLFFQSRGVVDITAATNDCSYGMPIVGGFFTASLEATLRGDVKKDISDWKQCFNAVQFKTSQIYQKADSRGLIDDTGAATKGPQVPKAFLLGEPAGGAVATDKDKRYAVILFVNPSETKPITISYRWTNSTDKKMVKLTLKPKEEQLIFTEMVGNDPLAKCAFSMSDVEGELSAKEWKGVGNPTAKDGLEWKLK